jgi:ATP dependent DNA ligase domain
MAASDARKRWAETVARLSLFAMLLRLQMPGSSAPILFALYEGPSLALMARAWSQRRPSPRTYGGMFWRNPPGRSRRTPPVGFIIPCQPLLVPAPPTGLGWLHEVKHDGYRIIARKEGSRVTLWSRYGTNFTDRLPKIAEAVRSLTAESALIDGEAVAVRLVAEGALVFARACEMGLEGIVSKRAGSRY